MTSSSAAPQNKVHQGLSASEVERSRGTHGRNVLTPPPSDPWWVMFLEKFDDPVIRILLFAAAIALGVGVIEGQFVEGVGIIVAILLATTMAFANEYKARKEFEVLNQVSDEMPVKVFREGAFTVISRHDIVVGDIVQVGAGDEIPADGQVIEARSLHVDESQLTGESVPASKVPSPQLSSITAETAYSADRVLRGSMVVDGHGMIEITAVGDATEIGRTAKGSSEETGIKSPLTQQLERLSKLIGVVAFLVAGLLYGLLMLRGLAGETLHLDIGQWYVVGLLLLAATIGLSRIWIPVFYDGLELLGREATPPEWLEREGAVEWLTALAAASVVFGAGIGAGIVSGIVPAAPALWLPSPVWQELLHYFMIAVTVIVVAVPEGLVMSVTLSLAYSMRKMTRSNNLVRRMHACETIGAATVICSDKTGTLTENNMQVYAVEFPALRDQRVHSLARRATERLVIEGIAANSTVHLVRDGDKRARAHGANATETALLLWLADHEIDYQSYRPRFQVLKQWTFSTERKLMATLGSSSINGGALLHVKGAPEVLLETCTHVLAPEGVVPLDGRRESIRTSLSGFQQRGMRTLGFAFRRLEEADVDLELGTLLEGMVWLGFAVLSDPIRADVREAVMACREAGILVKIVTGDSPDTAQEIARQISLWMEEDGHERHVAGGRFAEMDDDDARKTAASLKILSRARSMDKMRLVKLLREQNHVVAVTGDGVNDGPALNHADVGLAMGRSGTAVARAASDIILLDDSFQSIVKAVMWGRSLYENIQKFIVFQLTINIVACSVALLGPLVGVKFPFTVIQMLWVNLIMDTFAALALATEPPHWSVMRRPPRDPRAFIITPGMARTILTAGLGFLAFLVCFLLYIQNDGYVSDLELSRFFTTFIMLQFWNMFNARSLGRSRSALAGLTENPGFLSIAAVIFLGQILIIQLGGGLFRTVPLSWAEWVTIVAGTSVVLWVGELARLVERRRTPAA